MFETVENYYHSKKEPIKSCLLALKEIILRLDPLMTETQKWGMPCFCYKNKIFCYLSIDSKKDIPYIMMVEGRHLDIPALESGNRSKMKVFHVDPNADFDLVTINHIMQEALNLYRTGLLKTSTKNT